MKEVAEAILLAHEMEFSIASGNGNGSSASSTASVAPGDDTAE